MLLDNKKISGGFKDYRNKIMVFSSYGDKINEINVETLIPDYNPKINWPVFGFTKEEDILMFSSDGYLLVVDPVSEVVKV